MKQAFIAAFALGIAIPAQAQPTVENYGNLPSVRSMVISANGERLGYLASAGEREALAVFDLTYRQNLGGARTDLIKTRRVYFAGPDHVILNASVTTDVSGFRGAFEYSVAFAYSLKTKKIVQLLKENKDLFPAQTGLGRIVGMHPDGDAVFMPAYIGERGRAPKYNLLRVNLNTGRGRVVKFGRPQTQDWFVDKDGTVLAREEFDSVKETYTIRAGRDGKLVPIKIYKDRKTPPLTVHGVKADKSALIVSLHRENNDTNQLAEMSFTGNISPPIFQRDDAGIARVLSDINRRIIGVSFTGLFPTYEFFDTSLTATVAEVQSLFPGASVSLSDWSEDLTKFVFHVTGGTSAPSYHMFDRSNNTLFRIANTYAGITDDNVAEVVAMDYTSRDGVKIPAVLTRPRGWVEGQKYPTIILPHGGPASYDSVRFDWMAQFFANAGYLVLQPNFRGSTGFGFAFTEAGDGEWGRGIMQHDVSDGLKALVDKGWTDPGRVCIVGASYGGYAALAGGAFTPDLYQCVIAIAPVADLPRMMFDERTDSGSDSWVVSYWNRVIGDARKERDKLINLSPARHAEGFKAPVLLLHGNDDTVVPYRQSEIMERALKKAGKEVTLVKLKGEDHWLSTGETRLQLLKEMDVFVRRTIGENR